MDGVLTALQSRNNVLRRALEQCNQFCDEFVLRLDSAEEVEVLLAYIDSLFYVRSFEFRLSLTRLVTLGKLLDEFSRCITGVAEHECGVAFQCSEQLCVDTFGLEGFLEQRVLSYMKLDVLFEASTTQVTGLRSVQTLDINEVEVRVLSQLCAQRFNDEIFIFLFHTCL